ncbi:unnamed protein product [Linum trigynum]|uniref:Uncharacterized protein n=1 Tax=Linum trigynum TaxID=586398 RepID=A0AAV2DS42_9ROSI
MKATKPSASLLLFLLLVLALVLSSSMAVEIQGGSRGGLGSRPGDSRGVEWKRVNHGSLRGGQAHIANPTLRDQPAAFYHLPKLVV